MGASSESNASIETAGVVIDPERIADHVAISRLQSAYADVITRRAFDELHRLFVSDCEVHVDTVTRPVMELVGPAAFGEFVGAAVARFDHFEFVILNAVVDLDSTSDALARGRIFMCELRHDPAEGWSEAYGRYEDTYRRMDGRWWFTNRRYRSMARRSPAAGGLVEVV